MTDHPAAPELVPQQGVGEPDGFARLWTPQRLAYVQGSSNDPDSTETPSAPGVSTTAAACPFCRIPAMPDADGLLVARGERVYAVLNLYPYNPGHLMVVPFRHTADYADLSPDETHEFSVFTQHAIRALRVASGAQGFNVGINLGAIAGAGIAAHLHQHVVPRWGGDTNFMPVVGHTRVLPSLLGDTRTLLVEAWGNTA